MNIFKKCEKILFCFLFVLLAYFSQTFCMEFSHGALQNVAPAEKDFMPKDKEREGFGAKCVAEKESANLLREKKGVLGELCSKIFGNKKEKRVESKNGNQEELFEKSKECVDPENNFDNIIDAYTKELMTTQESHWDKLTEKYYKIIDSIDILPKEKRSFVNYSKEERKNILEIIRKSVKAVLDKYGISS